MSTDANKELVYRYFDETVEPQEQLGLDDLLGDGMDPDDAKKQLRDDARSDRRS
jgi:hypothetical protein